MSDVARLAGVSIKTVSNVVNDYPHISVGTRERVLAAIAELGYVPNSTARSLRSGRSGVIGLAVPELSLAYFAQLADEVIRAARAQNMVVLVEQTGGERERELEVLRGPRLQLTDGLLFSPLGLGNGDAEVARVPYPLVLLGERIFDPGIDHVTMQNVEAAEAAVEHLLGLGRRRIVALGAHQGEVIGSAGLRLTGYRNALASAGIGVDEALVVEEGLWHRRNGADAMRRLLATGVQFDAVFALNDELALGALRVIQESGLRVPDDVAVIGFDDVDEGNYSIPSLSTVDPGRQEIAETAVDLLLTRIEGRAGPEKQQLRTGYRIVPRESTGV
ncbi:MAG: LacI family DNA-binding transcriptional regulator [Actinomycetales bacterium]|nr:LacI family DNA-binding transcriptional regulator [Actinomycetales bacterium]